MHCTKLYLFELIDFILQHLDLLYQCEHSIHGQLKVLLPTLHLMVAHPISPHHLPTPYHFVFARNASFLTHQIVLPSLAQLPLPVASLWFVRARHFQIPDSFTHVFIFFESLVFPTEWAVWGGASTRVTVDDVTVAIWSLRIHWYVVAFGTVDLFPWFHGEGVLWEGDKIVVWEHSGYTAELLLLTNVCTHVKKKHISVHTLYWRPLPYYAPGHYNNYTKYCRTCTCICW